MADLSELTVSAIGKLESDALREKTQKAMQQKEVVDRVKDAHKPPPKTSRIRDSQQSGPSPAVMQREMAAERKRRAEEGDAEEKMKKIEQIEAYCKNFAHLRGASRIGIHSAMAEIDAELHAWESALNSEGALEMAKGLFIAINEAIELLGPRFNMDLSSSIKLHEVAAHAAAKNRHLEKNLMRLQIKYGFFSAGPEVQLAAAWYQMVKGVDAANKRGGAQPAAPAPAPAPKPDLEKKPPADMGSKYRGI